MDLIFGRRVSSLFFVNQTVMEETARSLQLIIFKCSMRRVFSSPYLTIIS